MISQTLRGLVGQGMNGRRGDLSPTIWTYPATPPSTSAPTSTSYTFTAPSGGWYRFVMWGAGGAVNDDSGGGGGALVIAERVLGAGQRVALSVGSGAQICNQSNATATLPNGEVLTAGGGSNGGNNSAGGIATCNAQLGDIGVNGPTGLTSTSGGVAGATSGNYAGGPAAAYGSQCGGFPGGGGPGIATGNCRSGDGQIIITQTRLRQ